MHFLIFLAPEDKIHDITQIDRIVCAEFPDQDEDPVLFNIILENMVHGPYSRDRCLDENGRCKKHFPKPFQQHTTLEADGYPLYRRREDGREFEKNGHLFTNRLVVPYNPDLSRKYECHINIEICALVRAVKYIHKYIYKGHDRATMRFGEETDEIQQYLDARYIGASEAIRHLLEMPMHEEKPNVVCLAVHLLEMHQVLYNPQEDFNVILERGQNQRTMLTAYFNMCSSSEQTCQYTYQEFPQHYVWQSKQKHWTKRKQGFVISRLYTAHPRAGERFYLRLLLTVVRGPRSFEDLRTINGVTLPTYKDACVQLGLLEDDGEWAQCLEEAGVMRTGSHLHNLFALILNECHPTHPELLWERFCENLCDDLAHHLHKHYQIPNPSNEDVLGFGLYLIDEILHHQSNKNLSDFPPMPTPIKNWSQQRGNRFVEEQLN
jgi:hypothetical protein